MGTGNVCVPEEAMRMKRLAGWAIIATICLAGGAVAHADAHVVSPEQLSAALSASAGQRATDLATLDAFLSSPAAESAAHRAGVDLDGARAGVTSLTDAEIHDLAQRAERLPHDPVAGLDADVNQLLVVFLVVAIVILVLQAIN
jgi:hypothetical protein